MNSPTERQSRLIWLACSGLAVAVIVALVVGVIWGLGRLLHLLSPVLWPLAVAGVLAYLLDPVVDFFERKGVPRPRAIICVFALALVVMGAFVASVLPQMVRETRELAQRVPGYTTRMQEHLQAWVDHPPSWARKLLETEAGAPGSAATNAPTQTNSLESSTITTTNSAAGASAPAPANTALLAEALTKHLKAAASWLATGLSSAGAWLIGRVVSGLGLLAGLALIPVCTFYFLLEKERISTRWTDYLPLADSDLKNESVFILTSINNYLIAFFRGQVLVAICDGALYGIGFLIIGLPYAILIGVAAMVLTIIPYLGAIIICIVSLLIGFVQYGTWRLPLLVLAVFAVVQTLEGLVISPKIMGGKTGLHPLTIIIAVMAGTTLLGGLLGAILAIPLTAALRVIMFRYVWKRPVASEAQK